ncbi:dolichyl-diphosphooligosaccharide--protein glycosyltransferase 48 kDa subunit-like [Durio zibethinus]|uniref:Dolichyl-diphosphooligosaccharide--protein glycosyltransferase 48 kDa subunit-like n=1 Tax=Durio zibethinus TaxID=66656 RepID=A0A6P6AXA8_DURZI|nr:dolichyl-diphosphooligosaccharide--protein glycosyltransferase 48 kDa subunit-like [Durio zibethinus]
MANGMVLKLLSAFSLAYSANPKFKFLGPQLLTRFAISLASVVQARNNAQIMITSSLDVFSNQLFITTMHKIERPFKFENQMEVGKKWKEVTKYDEVLHINNKDKEG